MVHVCMHVKESGGGGGITMLSIYKIKDPVPLILLMHLIRYDTKFMIINPPIFHHLYTKVPLS